VFLFVAAIFIFVKCINQFTFVITRLYVLFDKEMSFYALYI